VGMLATHFRSVHKPSEQDLRLLDLYVRQAADIIERYKAEDALRESEERLRLAQLKTGIGLWDWDLRTGKVTWTPELEASYGLKPGAVKCYADFRDRVHPNAQLALAGKAALVGTYAYDVDTKRIRVSEGYAAIHGLPEGTTEIPHRQWQAGVHPEDLGRIETLREQAYRERQREYNAEYRIIRGGEVRWIEARKFISYDGDGHPQRSASTSM